MALIQHDHMVKQISPAVTHESLGDAVLLWALETVPFGLDAEGLNGGNNFFAKAGSSIEDQVAGRRVVRERLTQLLNHPALLGCLVTLQLRIRCRLWAMTKKQ